MEKSVGLDPHFCQQNEHDETYEPFSRIKYSIVTSP